MTTLAVTRPSAGLPIKYPESDGAPIAENTLQYQWIVTISGGLEHMFTDRPDVLVAADVFWYPVEGRPDVRVSPDVLVAFGRPRGHRGSYMQWEEGGVAPQVVFEVLSPDNRYGEMSRKFAFYARHGVEEFYIYNPQPDRTELSGFVRRQDELAEIADMNAHVSPRLGVRFEMPADGELRILGANGEPFKTFKEIYSERDAERNRANAERRRADEAEREVDRLRERLRALGAE